MNGKNLDTLTIAELLEEDLEMQSIVVADCHHPNVYYAEDDE